MTAKDPFSSLTREDVPLEIEPEAEGLVCPHQEDHPGETGSRPGFGYAGGGFGAYRICSTDGRVFAKRAVKDGNQ